MACEGWGRLSTVAGPLSVLVALAGVAVLPGCGSASAPGTSSGGGGTVSVLYAGSLEELMEADIGPGFSRATGYGFEGFGAGSDELVSQIKSGVRRGDVLISASATPNLELEGAANGNRESWYVTFATAPLVLGYSPGGPHAGDFRSQPWYRVVTQPGVRVGRTDPLLDPKGRLTVQAVDQAALRLGMPQLETDLRAWPVFPEETLVGRLQAGQLDAGFLYSFEASAQRIPTVSLAPASLGATFTVTVLSGAPDPAAARAFVTYLLGPAGRTVLRNQGVDVLPPTLSGPSTEAPPWVRGLVGG
jgi:molybdate/tungstate transport system substrate-binding protein